MFVDDNTQERIIIFVAADMLLVAHSTREKEREREREREEERVRERESEKESGCANV